MQRAFHMYAFTPKVSVIDSHDQYPSIFVVDKYSSRFPIDSTTSDQRCRSTSMTHTDRQPLQNTPMARRIMDRHNNRYGAVLSAFWPFWHSREGATRNAPRPGTPQDTYTLLLFSAPPQLNQI